MTTMLKQIGLSVFFGLVMEFEINIFIKQSIGAMIGVLILYSLLGVLTYYTFPFLKKMFGGKSRGFWVALFLHGLLGLLVIEWGFMGNSPQALDLANVTKGDKPMPLLLMIILQFGMFVWWSGIATLPQIFRTDEGKHFRKAILTIYTLYALISIPLTVTSGMAPVILIEPFVYASFFYFYTKYAHALLA
jgi:hypothetical protein